MMHQQEDKQRQLMVDVTPNALISPTPIAPIKCCNDLLIKKSHMVSTKGNNIRGKKNKNPFLCFSNTHFYVSRLISDNMVKNGKKETVSYKMYKTMTWMDKTTKRLTP